MSNANDPLASHLDGHKGQKPGTINLWGQEIEVEQSDLVSKMREAHASTTFPGLSDCPTSMLDDFIRQIEVEMEKRSHQE